MKMRHSIYYLVFIFFSSCLEEIDTTEDRFIKVYGKQNASHGQQIIQDTETGKLMLIGDVGVPAFDFVNEGGNFVAGKVEERSPAVIIANREGNQEMIRSYPIAGYDMGSIQADISDRGSFNEIIKNEDGSYFVVGEWSGMDYAIPELNIYISDPTNRLPFYARLDRDFNFLEIRSFNGEEDWDQLLHIGATLEKTPQNTIMVLLMINATLEGFFGYILQELSPSGETLLYKQFYGLPNNDIKFARDFCYNREGDIILIGERRDRIVAFKVEPSNGYAESTYDIDDKGEAGYNRNPMFIFELQDGGYGAVYPRARDQQVVFHHLASTLSKIKWFDISADIFEYPRAAFQAKNGDIIVYNEQIEIATPRGFLYRFTVDGDIIFRLQIDGTPGDVKEAEDGSLLVLHNPVYNEQLSKMTLTKLSADGKKY